MFKQTPSHTNKIKYKRYVNKQNKTNILIPDAFVYLVPFLHLKNHLDSIPLTEPKKTYLLSHHA